jgi:hypothetical protein
MLKRLILPMLDNLLVTETLFQDNNHILRMLDNLLVTETQYQHSNHILLTQGIHSHIETL